MENDELLSSTGLELTNTSMQHSFRVSYIISFKHFLNENEHIATLYSSWTSTSF